MINIVALLAKACQDASLKVVAEIPSGATRPIMRLQENGLFGPSSHMPDQLYEYDVQGDVWGTSKSDAFTLWNSTLQVFRSQPSNLHGVVTRFEPVGMDYQPDEDWPVNNLPGPRYITILRFFAHP